MRRINRTTALVIEDKVFSSNIPGNKTQKDAQTRRPGYETRQTGNNSQVYFFTTGAWLLSQTARRFSARTSQARGASSRNYESGDDDDTEKFADVADADSASDSDADSDTDSDTGQPWASNYKY